MAEAQAAGVATKDNWRKFPAAMLRARAASALVRAVYPDVLLGVYDSDSGELEDAAPAPAPVIVEAVPEPSRAEEYARRIEAADTIEALALVAVDVRNDRLLAPDDAAA